MSTDERVTTDLIETLEDGKKGFAAAADRLADTNRADLVPTFRQWSEERGRFAEELRGMAAAYGDDIDEQGSTAATIHRGWMAVKDAIAGSDADGVLDAAEQGEDHAVSEYRKALGEDDVSPNLRQTIERQFGTVKQVHDQVRALRNAVSD